MTTTLTLDQIREQNPVAAPALGLGRLALLSFRQIVLNPFNLGFALALPLAMYFMFGVGQEYSNQSVGNGNVSAQILVSMTQYGVMLSTASFGANVSLERAQGIGRLYALTPLSPSWQIVGRLLSAAGVAAVMMAVTFSVGGATGASMTGAAWAGSAILMLVTSVLSAAIGFACGFAIRSDGAFAATSGIIVLTAFAAGMMFPLDQLGQFFQTMAPWTPLWGANQLVLLPIHGWDNFILTMPLNLVAWTAAFGGVAVWGLRRDTGR